MPYSCRIHCPAMTDDTGMSTGTLMHKSARGQEYNGCENLHYNSYSQVIVALGWEGYPGV